MSATKKKLIFALCAAVLIAAAVIVYLAFDLQIPLTMRVDEIVFYDIYASNHFLLSSSSKLYDITIDRYIGSDNVKRESYYSFTCTVDGNKIESTLSYPGTPNRQYVGFPRLTRGERYILICGDSLTSGRAVDSYYLFYLQEVDGVEYAYPIYYDQSMIPLSVICDNVQFKYISESRIYDEWHDEDVYDWFEVRSMEIPEFTYKLPANELRENYRLLTRNDGG